MGKPKKHAYLVCETAKCTCSGSDAPTALIPLKVTSQSKYFLGNDKLIATEKDSKGLNLNFGACRNTPDGKPLPCMAKCAISWTDYYDSIDFTSQHLRPLLDISKGTCKGYKGVDANITIKDHGQPKSKRSIDVRSQSLGQMRMISTLFEKGDKADKDWPVVDHIEVHFDGQPALLATSGKTAKPILIEAAGHDRTLVFKSIIKKGNAKLANWAYYDKHNFDSMLRNHLEWGAEYQLVLRKNRENKFRIESYGTTPGDGTCALDFDVRQDAIISVKEVRDIKQGLINIPCVFEAKFLFDEPGYDGGDIARSAALQWTVEQLDGKKAQTLYSTATGNYEQHIITVVPILFMLKLEVIFKNKGAYKITAIDSRTGFSQSTTIDIAESIKILSLSHPGQSIFRPSDVIKLTATYNVSKVLTHPNDNVWRVFYEHQYQKPDLSGAQFSGNARNFQDLFHLPTAYGHYRIHAYATVPGSFSVIDNSSKSGSDTFFFTVKDNELQKVDGPTAIPTGGTGTYTAQGNMELNEAEKGQVIWTISGGKHTITYPQAGDTSTAKISFEENAAYSITAHLSNTSAKVTPALNVTAAPMRLKRALWCYSTGQKRTEISYGEECYAFVELEGLKKVDGKLQVWLMPGGADNENVFAKPDLYRLQELPVSLHENADTHTAEGNIKITLDDDAYKKKIADLALPANALPQLIFTISLEGDSTTSFAADAPIEGAAIVPAGGKTYYKVLTDDEWLTISNRSYIKSIVFANEKGDDIQRAYTTYGKKHALWLHTSGMAGQKLTLKIYKEVPATQLDATWKQGDKTVLVAEEVASAEKEIGKDGVAILDFELKQDWKPKETETEAVRYFVASAYKKVKDAEGKESLQLADSQYSTNDNVGLQTVFDKDHKQVGICIPQLKEGVTPDNDQLIEVKRRYLVAHNQLVVVKDLVADAKPDVTPVVVEFGDVSEWKQTDCQCEERIRAYMRMLRVGEGTGELIKSVDKKTKQVVYKPCDFQKGYTTAFAFNTISDLSTHPQKIFKAHPDDKQGSSAAGAYQVMRENYWQMQGFEVKNHQKGRYLEAHDLLKKYNINDYSAESQDKICIIILKNNRPGSLSLITRNEFEKATRGICSAEWASLPCIGDNSRYNYNGKPQSATPFVVCLEHYDEFLIDEIAGRSPLHLKKGFLREFGILCECGKKKKEVVTLDGKWHNPLDRMELSGWYSTWDPSRSKFGKQPSRLKGSHQGIDIYAPVGTPVYACIDGKINMIWDDPTGYGHVTELTGFYNDNKFSFVYCHLSKRAISDGNVKAGDIIGYTGKTGNASSLHKNQEHLHFEVRSVPGRFGGGLLHRIDPIDSILDIKNTIIVNPSKESQK